MTRRFDIGPVLLALAALVLLVSLFLPWVDYGDTARTLDGGPADGSFSAWRMFEVTDLLLAALAIAAAVAAAGLITPSVDYVERRFIPWITGVAFILVANQVVSSSDPSGLGNRGTGLWLAFAATVLMIVGAVLSLTKVSFAVAVEGRDRRRRVATVDHRPPPTETGTPVPRSSTSLLNDPPEAEAGQER